MSPTNPNQKARETGIGGGTSLKDGLVCRVKKIKEAVGGGELSSSQTIEMCAGC
jgi:hypothetical protein